MAEKRWRAVCEHAYMLAVCFFLLWNVFYMTEAQWTFDVRGAFPAAWLGLAGAALVLCRMKPGAAYAPLLALPVWMLLSSAYRGAAVLSAQTADICRAVLAFGVMLPAARVVRRNRFAAYMKALLALWTACMTLQAAIGLWAALTGHAVFSLKGTWYIGVNLGDHRLYLNAYVTTGAVKMGLSVLLAGMGLVNSRKVPCKVIYALCMLTQLVCLSLTDCRTAFIAVGAGMGLMAAAGVLGLKWRSGWLRWGLAALLAPACALGAYVALSGLLTALAPHVPGTLDNLTLPEIPLHLLRHAAAEGAVQHRALEASNLFNDRQIIWRAAVQLLLEEPRFLLTGTTTALAPGLTNAMIPPEIYPGRDFVHVHSIYLQMLTSWGLPGLLLLGAGLLAFARAAWRVMVRHEGLCLWERCVPVPVFYVLLCELVDCFTRLSEESPLLLFACLFAGLTLATDAHAALAARQKRPLARGTADVIIPAYNAAEYVARAVKSALECPDARVILVDDGSTDGTGEICDALAADARVQVLHQANAGAAAARNAGLQAATAEYVAFLDADDVLLPGALAALTEQIGTADAIQGRIVRNAPEMYHNPKTYRFPAEAALSLALGDPTRHLLCHGWLLRRSLLTERFNERLTLGEDGEWMLRTLAHAGGVALCSTPVYRYTLRADSALHSGGTEVIPAYEATLAAAAPTLEALNLPAFAGLYRLTHLLLALTHGDLSQMRPLRDKAPFAQDFDLAPLRGFSPRIVALRLLRDHRYAAAAFVIRCRRMINHLRGWLIES